MMTACDPQASSAPADRPRLASLLSGHPLSGLASSIAKPCTVSSALHHQRDQRRYSYSNEAHAGPPLSRCPPDQAKQQVPASLRVPVLNPTIRHSSKSKSCRQLNCPIIVAMDARVVAQLQFYDRREKLSKRHLRALQHQAHYLRLSLQPVASHEVLLNLTADTPPPPTGQVCRQL